MVVVEAPRMGDAVRILRGLNRRFDYFFSHRHEFA